MAEGAWGWVLLLVVIIVLTAGLVLFVTLAPLPHHIPESFLLPGVQVYECSLSANFSSPHDGSFDFSWAASANHSGNLDLVGAPVTGGVVYFAYTGSGTNGSGSVNIYSGYLYSWGFCGGGNETLQISGTLTFLEPLL